MVRRKSLTTKEAAAYLTKELGLKVSTNLLAQWRFREDGPPWRRTRGRIYYDPKDLELFVRQRRADYCWPVGVVLRALLQVAPELLADYVSIDNLRADIAAFSRKGKLTWQAALTAMRSICPWINEIAFHDALLSAEPMREILDASETS